MYIYINMQKYIYTHHIPMISFNSSPLDLLTIPEAWWHLPRGERSFTTPVFVAWSMVKWGSNKEIAMEV